MPDTYHIYHANVTYNTQKDVRLIIRSSNQFIRARRTRNIFNLNRNYKWLPTKSDQSSRWFPCSKVGISASLRPFWVLGDPPLLILPLTLLIS